MKRILILLISLIRVSHAQELKLIVPIQSKQVTLSAKISSDGKKIVTASFDRTAKIWDIATGKILADLKGSKEQLEYAQFSPNGKLIFTISTKGEILLWDVIKGTIQHTLRGTAANFSPDGEILFIISKDGEIRKFYLKTGTTQQFFKVLDQLTKFIQISPDGKSILTADRDNSLKMWNINTGKLLVEFKGHSDIINSAQFSSDGAAIITSSNDQTVKIWDANSGNLLRDLRKFTAPTLYAQFSNDNKKLLTFSRGDYNSYGNISVFETFSDSVLNNIKIWGPKHACFSPDSKKILVLGGQEILQLFDINTGNVIQKFPSHGSDLKDVQFTSDNKKIIIYPLSADNYKRSTFLVDMKTAVLIPYVFEGNERAERTIICPDQKKMATLQKGRLRIYDMISKSLIVQLKLWSDSQKDIIEFSPEGDKILTITKDVPDYIPVLKIWDTNTGVLISTTKLAKDNNYIAKFSSDSKKIVTSSSPSGNIQTDSKIEIWDANTCSLLLSKVDDPLYKTIHFMDNNTKIAVSESYCTKILDAATGNVIGKIQDSCFVNYADLDPSGKKIITACGDGTAKIYDFETKKLQSVINLKSDALRIARFSPNGKTIITSGYDGILKIWDAVTKKLIYTFIVLDSTDYICIIPTGYYKCSLNATKLLHYITKDLRVLGFKQLDLKYNRPDKVLEAIGNTDTSLIKAYRRAYEKRIKRLGVDTASFMGQFSIPEADFVNRDSLEIDQLSDQLILHIKGSDKNYKLDRFNIWINNVPLFSRKGLNIKWKKSNSIDTTLTIQLSQGKNIIETSILNVNGSESYRMPLVINYNPTKPFNNRVYFIGIGIDEFADNKYNLKWSRKDIIDLVNGFKEKYQNSINVDTLFNQQVTLQNIIELKNKLSLTNVNDKVIIAYSGHGLLSKDYDYYLSPYNVNFTNPEINGIPYYALENLIDSIPARKKLLLIDACHSGEVDQDDHENRKQIDKDDGKPKGIKLPAAVSTGKVGLKNSFELMQELFMDVGKSTGAIIISAASGSQFAFEREDLKNGAFTSALKEAMKNNKVMSANQLKAYVIQRVPELTNGKQQPTTRSDNSEIDWDIW